MSTAQVLAEHPLSWELQDQRPLTFTWSLGLADPETPSPACLSFQAGWMDCAPGSKEMGLSALTPVCMVTRGLHTYIVFLLFQKLAYAITPEKEREQVDGGEVRQFTVSATPALVGTQKHSPCSWHRPRMPQGCICSRACLHAARPPEDPLLQRGRQHPEYVEWM